MSRTNIFLDRRRYSNQIDVFIKVGENDFVKSLSIERIEPGFIAPAALTISTSEAQHLIDELWGIGLRPSEGSGSAGSLAATQKHLEDMRRLVFDQPTVITQEAR